MIRRTLGAEAGTVVLIQIVAAVLLLAGSGLIFRALVELDAPTRPRLVVRRRPLDVGRADEQPARERRAA